jgi:hypothetical protein
MNPSPVEMRVAVYSTKAATSSLSAPHRVSPVTLPNFRDTVVVRSSARRRSRGLPDANLPDDVS